MTWVEVHNAVYGRGGPFVRLFPSAKDRMAFAKTKESREIDRLLDSLPEPPVSPQRHEHSGNFNVRVAERKGKASASINWSWPSWHSTCKHGERDAGTGGA